MAPTPPSSEPEFLVIGDSWQWDRHLSETPPSEGYTLTYELAGPSDVATITASTSASGDYFEVRENAAAHSALTAGTYEWAAYATKGADRFTVDTGAFRLVSDLSQVAAAQKSQAETDLAAIQTAIDTVIASPNAEVDINGRSFTRQDLDDLIEMRGKLRHEVWRGRNPGRIGPAAKARFLRA